MDNYIEDFTGVLQSFGAAAIAFLVLPVLITALARNVTLALSASLLSFASLMLFVAPASAVSALAMLSGLGSFVVALDSIFARRRMVALNTEIADLTNRLNQLEAAEQRRVLEVMRAPKRKRGRRGQPMPASAATGTLSALRPVTGTDIL
jgi:hypothetical protein